MDDKELLIKYMMYVIDREGFNYIGKDGESFDLDSGSFQQNLFTEDEIKSLKLASKLAYKRYDCE